MGKSPPTDDLVRRRTMSRIKNKNTSIEIALQKAIWHLGIRYRKNYTKLPGAPDIAITKYRIAIFCDGEFWHGKDWVTKKPKIQSNREYWIAKIERNMARDNEANEALSSLGWTVIRFWGTDISKDLEGCVRKIKDAILKVEISSEIVSHKPIELYAKINMDNGRLKVAEEQHIYQVEKED